MTDKEMWKDVRPDRHGSLNPSPTPADEAWQLNEAAQRDHIQRLNADWRGESANPLPTDAAGRKAIPLASGCIDYFTSALLAVASLSRVGNEQHNPGQPLHWDRSKSGDEADALSRHFAERGTVDTDRIRHSTKVAWRALALLQKELEEQEGAPVPRGCINVPAN